MMALQILLLLQVIVILFSPRSSAYPVYGTKSQSYPDDYYYYPQDTYPVYYPRTSKYEVYQAVLPYYYGDRPIPGRYYDTDPVVDLQEEMIQEAERKEREEAQPIGHELLYENEDATTDDGLDEANAAFLQNLIVSQMYKDAMNKQKDYYDPDGDYPEEYGKWEGADSRGSYYPEDEDVRELKQLAKPKAKAKLDDVHWYQRGRTQKEKSYNEKRDVGDNKLKTFTDRKPVVKATTMLPSSTVQPRHSRGQKEEVLARPATPVRHPFPGPVLEMMTKNDVERKRSPSVYDTIKHMLDMEKSLENKYGADEIKPHMKKRIISSEQSLTQQLSVLKKSPQK